jgi:hypothetical protein
MHIFGIEITGQRIVGIALVAMIGYGGYTVYVAAAALAARMQ